MKNDDLKKIIKFKETEKEPKKKRTQTAIVAISLVCMFITLVFIVALIMDFKLYDELTGANRRIVYEEEIKPDGGSAPKEYDLRPEKMNQEKKLHFDLGGMIFLTERGRQKLNYVMIIRLLLTVIMAAGVYCSSFYKLSKKYFNRLDNIDASVTNMAMGEFDVRLEEDETTQLGIISTNINNMAKRFDEILKENKKSEESRTELITSIAHDLRTPVTSVMGYLQLVISKELDDETRDKYIRVAYDKSIRLEHLIEDLFTYTKFSIGNYPLQYSKIDIGTLLEQMVDEFYPQFMEEDLNCTFTGGSNLNIEADGELLARLFANLLSNSIKYGKEGKSIKVEAMKENDDNVCVKVTNYGRIIPKDDLERIFDRFYRVESSRSRTTGGTGLGLAIVNEIVTLHKGTIEVTSGMEGTVFTVRLPIRADKEKEV